MYRSKYQRIEPVFPCYSVLVEMESFICLRFHPTIINSKHSKRLPRWIVNIMAILLNLALESFHLGFKSKFLSFSWLFLFCVIELIFLSHRKFGAIRPYSPRVLNRNETSFLTIEIEVFGTFKGTERASTNDHLNCPFLFLCIYAKKFWNSEF